MRDFGHEQKGLIRHRRERGDANRFRISPKNGFRGGSDLWRPEDGPAPTEIRERNGKKIYVIWPGEYGEISYRMNDSVWQRLEIPITPAHGSQYWMSIPEWAVPCEIKLLAVE